MPRTLYTLIERPDCHQSAVSHAVLADMQARGEALTILGPVTKARIKAERIHVYQDAHYFEQVAFQDWKTRAHGKTFKARVCWFNFGSGAGMVEIPDLDKRLPIYACNIAGKKTWYPETACAFYMEGDEVEVKLDVNIGQTFVIGLTPGYIDNEKWDRIKDTDLAFRCDETGKAVTGLFA